MVCCRAGSEFQGACHVAAPFTQQVPFKFGVACSCIAQGQDYRCPTNPPSPDHPVTDSCATPLEVGAGASAGHSPHLPSTRLFLCRQCKLQPSRACVVGAVRTGHSTRRWTGVTASHWQQRPRCNTFPGLQVQASRASGRAQVGAPLTPFKLGMQHNFTKTSSALVCCEWLWYAGGPLIALSIRFWVSESPLRASLLQDSPPASSSSVQVGDQARAVTIPVPSRGQYYPIPTPGTPSESPRPPPLHTLL